MLSGFSSNIIYVEYLLLINKYVINKCFLQIFCHIHGQSTQMAIAGGSVENFHHLTVGFSHPLHLRMGRIFLFPILLL